jgi:hypothetical protein
MKLLVTGDVALPLGFSSLFVAFKSWTPAMRHLCEPVSFLFPD